MSIDHGLGLPGAVRQRRRLRRGLISGNDGRDDSRVILGCLIPGERLRSRIRRPEQGCNLPLNLNGGGRQPLRLGGQGDTDRKRLSARRRSSGVRAALKLSARFRSRS